MNDHIDRVAAVIREKLTDWLGDEPDSDAQSYWIDDTYGAAEALDAAGLLVTPAHDAEVAAKAWAEGYGCGVHDERVAADYNAGTTEGVEPCRVNPYEAGERDE